jgi:hypothetical protein
MGERFCFGRFGGYNHIMSLFLARSFSVALVASSTPSQLVRVLSLHRSVINFVTETGDLLAVVNPSIGDGPFHIVLETPARFDFIPLHAEGIWQGRSLALGHVRIDWSRAQGWNPYLASTIITRSALDVLQACAQKHKAFRSRWAGMKQHTVTRMQKGAMLLASGLWASETESLRQGLVLLMGVGPGLTPAGDDYLLGVMARLQMDSSWPDVVQVGELISGMGVKTTRLSWTWLMHAAHGEFDERWHHLRLALMQQDELAICRACHDVLQVGASSGPQAMAGFLLMDALQF